MKLENKQIGVFVAIIAGVMMLVVSGTGSSRYAFKPEEIAKAIVGNEDHIDRRSSHSGSLKEGRLPAHRYQERRGF